MQDKYKSIRPFSDEELKVVLPALACTEYAKQALRYATPDLTDEQITEKITSCRTLDEFIIKVSFPIVSQVLKKTAHTVTRKGFEQIGKDSFHVFVSNHRDIVMDSIILNKFLCEKGLNPVESAIGNNLVPDQMSMTVAKLCKNFLVYRDLPIKELLVSSRLMSEYIHYDLYDKKTSVWIAQREGRSKDGDDRTDPAVIKMMCLSRKIDLIDYIKSLKIIPVAVSYEWDPNDVLKIPALLAKAKAEKYTKAPDEDYVSIMTGINGYKGDVNMSLGSVLDSQLDNLRTIQNPNDIFRAVASIIDRQIHTIYHLFPTNYVAYDILFGTDKYSSEYSAEKKEAFVERMNKCVGFGDALKKELFLSMYANPVINKYKYDQSEK